MAVEPEIHPTAIVYPGTKLGEGVRVLEHAVVGKQPALSPRSTAKREALPPAEIGDGTIVSTGAVRGSAAVLSCSPASRSARRRSSVRAQS